MCVIAGTVRVWSPFSKMILSLEFSIHHIDCTICRAKLILFSKICLVFDSIAEKKNMETKSSGQFFKA